MVPDSGLPVCYFAWAPGWVKDDLVQGGTLRLSYRMLYIYIYGLGFRV